MKPVCMKMRDNKRELAVKLASFTSTNNNVINPFEKQLLARLEEARKEAGRRWRAGDIKTIAHYELLVEEETKKVVPDEPRDYAQI